MSTDIIEVTVAVSGGSTAIKGGASAPYEFYKKWFFFTIYNRFWKVWLSLPPPSNLKYRVECYSFWHLKILPPLIKLSRSASGGGGDEDWRSPGGCTSTKKNSETDRRGCTRLGDSVLNFKPSSFLTMIRIEFVGFNLINFTKKLSCVFYLCYLVSLLFVFFFPPRIYLIKGQGPLSYKAQITRTN